jgi:hypothetical protein
MNACVVCSGILGFMGYCNRCYGNAVKESCYVHVLQWSKVVTTSIHHEIAIHEILYYLTEQRKAIILFSITY